MGRPKTIDRETLLQAAEDIVMERGAGALTIDALAKAVGVTKGGVQYSFASKRALIDAMFDRWCESYDAHFKEAAGDAPTPLEGVRAHVHATRVSDASSHAKAAGLLAALLQSPEDLASTREWYENRVGGLDVSTEEGRRARLAFLAAEGAFLLRFMGLKEIDEQEWDDILSDVAEFLL